MDGFSLNVNGISPKEPTKFTDDDSLRSAFTDADLKRLKEQCEGDDLIGILDYNLPALLARLEAAEAVCQSVIDNDDEGNFKFSMKAWRMAAWK